VIGKLFNHRYEILEKLGSGGTAIVYRGQDTLLGRMVTIKILREEYASNEDFVRRFRREAQAVASLSHGNIVAVYDVGFEESMHYIVMEFVEGQSLKEYIKQCGSLPVQEVSSIMLQILDALSYAHEHGIIHRDIKPHNILLGKDGRAKVTDFGIAVGMTDMTQTYNTSSRIMGSVHYIAPEQVQGQPVTEKSDIYSAGVVFYEMLTGQLPFSGDTPISIAMQHVQGELILPHQLNPKIPMGLSYVVMRAMRKNPETRYDSAKEMAEAIRSVSEGLSSVYSSLPEENPDNTRELMAPLPDAETPPSSRGLFKHNSRKSIAKEPANRDYRREKRPAPRRKLNVMAIILLILVAALAGTMVWAVGRFMQILNPQVAVEDKVTVPDLVGRNLSDAEQQLLSLGLTPVNVRKNDDDIPLDTVMQQSPAALSSVGAGREVTLTVSDGPHRTEVPLVIGDTQMMAEAKLSSKGLTFSYDEPQYNEDFPAGDIFQQDPQAGEQVPGGTEVKLIISKGPELPPVKVPNVCELSLNDATAALTGAGLVVGQIKREDSSIYYADIVISQSAAADTELSQGDSVDLTVSRGPGPSVRTTTVDFTVPDDGISHAVSIEVSDNKGTRREWGQILSPGYHLQQMIQFYGQGTITVYVDEVAVAQYPLPAQ